MCKSGPSKYGSDTNKLRRVTFFSLTFPQLLTEFQCSVRLGSMEDTCYFENPFHIMEGGLFLLNIKNQL